jgi:hypothetical protein
MGLTYAGGSDNGYIRRLFDLEGASASLKCTLKAARSDFHNFTPTSGSPPALRTVYSRGNVQAMMKFCSVLQSSLDAVELTGSNNLTEGFEYDTPSASDYFNAFGVQMAIR